MNESNFIKASDKTNLTEQTKFRLGEIIGIENYFCQEVNPDPGLFARVQIKTHFPLKCPITSFA